MSEQPDFRYEGTRRVQYGSATFVPVCQTCGRYVRADDTMPFDGDDNVVLNPNATCRSCGRVAMLFEGYYDPYDV